LRVRGLIVQGLLALRLRVKATMAQSVTSSPTMSASPSLLIAPPCGRQLARIVPCMKSLIQPRFRS